MIVRDARPADIPAVHRLIGQLADAPNERAHAFYMRIGYRQKAISCLMGRDLT